MLRIPLWRLITWLVVGAGFFAGAKYAQVYFYASEFDDFVKDEVKFAPTRESTDSDHLTEHILDAAGQYGVDLDARDIKIRKTHTSEDIETLTVDVNYSAELDLQVYKPALHFHSTATISY